MKIFRQILIIFSICMLGTFAGKYIPFPSGVISLIVLLILMCTGIVKTRHIKETAEFILENMAFFFIPAGVKIMENLSEFSDSIAPILLIVVITTVLTFAVTAFTVAGLMKLMNKNDSEENTNGDVQK